VCEFVIAAAAEVGSTQNTPQRPQFEQESMADEDRVGWGMDGGMSPARTTMTRDEDLYDEPMLEDEEVPPTQQERYQGIFD